MRTPEVKKIDIAIEKEMMDSGAMGTGTVTDNIDLPDTEKEEFLNCEKYDSGNYYWEFDGNRLTISYAEEIES